MLEMVESRRKAGKEDQRYDLFSGLLDAATEEPDNGVAISDGELLGNQAMSHRFLETYLSTILGNMFLFLLAGHEVGPSPSSCSVALNASLQTAAHTLCFTFALLALHPDKQERLYQEIKGITSILGRAPVCPLGSLHDWKTEPL